MTKKSRKYRKAPMRAVGDAPSNKLCSRGDFQQNPTETTCSFISNTKQDKKQKKKVLKYQSQQPSGSKKKRSSVTLMSWKISSVSFFIPLDSHDRGYHDEVPSQNIIDWSNLLFYRCNRPAMLSYFPNVQDRKMYYYKPTVLPDLKLKYRTISESSTNSEDSFISFEHDDEDNDHCDYSAVNVNRCAFDRNEVASECEQSISKGKSQPRKQVRFVDNSQLVTVHKIIAWDYAYRAARVSPWMTIARDNKRFGQRIKSLETVISPVLSPEHRARIWETRMQNDD